MIISIFLFSIFTFRFDLVKGDDVRKFPDYFKFGVSTAAHQIEGAWNVSDKGENIWDHLTHTKPSAIADGSNADVACDSYHLYKRDADMLVELGVDFYRFSISWSRLLPNGFSNKVSQDGLRYYNNLIDELLSRNITPFATLYHWDLPQKLQDLGGWTNPIIVNYFEDYARVAFESFGNRVKNWITINEIPQICTNGYAKDIYAPQVMSSGIGDYLCGHNALLSHARVWHLYNDTFRPTQKGRIGITLYSHWAEPESNSVEDKAISERGMQFLLGWQAHPIFSSEGDYPKVLKEAVYNRSMEQGYSHSRLPVFTLEEIKYLKGASDFLGLNHYTSVVFRNDNKTEWMSQFPNPSKERDLGYDSYFHANWPPTISAWFAVNPPGLKHLLNWIKNEYTNPEVIITENGYLTRGGLIDVDRINYINQNLQSVLEAILDDHCNVTAYSLWSLMDNYEWNDGYRFCFGLYEVDFKSENRTRRPRMSAYVYKEILRTRMINPYYLPSFSDFQYETYKSSASILQCHMKIFSISVIFLLMMHFLF
ncbi:myrosinase 1-like [Arctopsyche grandis]|uniref:myrosinase 1-like n=1 Tax=Arctopsyche grandis TaxID=121162 RepID=UPI00406D73A7